MAHVEQQNRPRLTLEEAQKSSDSWVGMISHVLRNPEGDFSVMGHIVCEWCDYCTEQEDNGILIHEFREDPYESEKHQRK